MIWRMVHLPGSGAKSTSSPAAPVSTVASNSGPRRKRSRSSGMEFMSVVVGAAHVVAAFFTEQLALAACQPRGADRAVEHGELFLFCLLTQLGIGLFHAIPII